MRPRGRSETLGVSLPILRAEAQLGPEESAQLGAPRLVTAAMVTRSPRSAVAGESSSEKVNRTQPPEGLWARQ